MEPESWRYPQFPHSTTGSSVPDPSTQLTCSPDLVPLVIGLIPNSGNRAVSYLKLNTLGLPKVVGHFKPVTSIPEPSTSSPPCQSTYPWTSRAKPKPLQSGLGSDINTQILQNLETEYWMHCYLELCQDLHPLIHHQVPQKSLSPPTSWSTL